MHTGVGWLSSGLCRISHYLFRHESGRIYVRNSFSSSCEAPNRCETAPRRESAMLPRRPLDRSTVTSQKHTMWISLPRYGRPIWRRLSYEGRRRHVCSTSRFALYTVGRTPIDQTHENFPAVGLFFSSNPRYLTRVRSPEVIQSHTTRFQSSTCRGRRCLLRRRFRSIPVVR